MRNFTTWLIVIFGFMFWGFRVAGAFAAGTGMDFMIKPMDLAIEIPVLFISFMCICFIIKRKILAAIIYLVTHGFYYGVFLYQNINTILYGQVTEENYISIFFSFIGILLPILALLDLALDKSRTMRPKDKKTDWYYGNEKYDFSLRETQTYEIIEDVASLKSEIGILYLNEFNETVLRKILKSNDLQFTELFEAKPHIFISDKNPLAQKAEVTMAGLS